MNKPTLLYASPFWPMKSGISEYSEALIKGLDKYFNITIVIDNYSLENKEIRTNFDIIKYNFKENYSGYDYIIYNIGNNPYCHSYMYDMILKYPGFVILHDLILYYLTVGYYTEKNKLFQKIYELEGINGIQTVKESLRSNESTNLLHHKRIASLLPMNREIIENSNGIFVHSDYGKNLVNKSYANVNTYKIHLVKCETMQLNNENFLNKKFGIKEDDYIIGAVGFIAETKQNELTCLAIKEYNKTHEEKIHYVMIGEGNYVDHLLDNYVHKTGFLENREFFNAIKSCNLIMNLRYPYNGESSATLIQCMDMEIPCVVTDIGWFSEIPNNAVIKLPFDISIGQLSHEISILKNKDLKPMVNRAKDYVESNCMPEIVAKVIYHFMNTN